MTRKKAVNKGKDTRRRYTPALKQEALLLADTVGVTEAARLPPYLARHL